MSRSPRRCKIDSSAVRAHCVFLIYRFVPRKRLDWKSIAVGTVVATTLIVAARPMFYEYVQYFANYNLMYGGIAIAVVLLVWGGSLPSSRSSAAKWHLTFKRWYSKERGPDPWIANACI
mgnify:CR=1 FL=1